MRTLIFLVLGICMACGVQAQRKSKDTLVRYFDENLEPVSKKEAVFAGVIVRDAVGWNCLVYDDSMRIIVRGKYEDDNCKVKEGWFMYYYPDGTRASGGKYTKNLRHDNWKTWYENGQLNDSVIYNMGTIQGGAKSFHNNGVLAAEGNYLMGNFDGPWNFYHENGKPSTRELYKNNKLSDLECFDTLGVSQGINCGIARPPVIVGRYGGIEQYLADSLRPVKNKDGEWVEGYVSIQFTITKEGRLVNFRVLNSADLLLTREVIRVLTPVTNWYPAMSHNRAIDYVMTLNIPFFHDDPRGEERFTPLANPWDF